MDIVYRGEKLRYIEDFHGEPVLWITSPSQTGMEHMTFVGGHPDEYCIFLKDLPADEQEAVRKKVGGRQKNGSGNKYWNLFRDYAECFLVYCFGGWVYESIWCCMIYHRRGFINRGFLFGPWLPIYGIGVFIILGIFALIRIKKPLPVFIVGAVIATIAELTAS